MSLQVRIAIIGNSGSGKSTLARQLSVAGSVDVLDLDTIAWEPKQIAVMRSADSALADVQRFCSCREDWIVEGCYASLIEATLEHQPELVFLDPGSERCVSNCRSRPWEPHKYASKAEQDEKLPFLIQWATEYYTRDGDMSLKGHRDLYQRYTGPKRRLTELSVGLHG